MPPKKEDFDDAALARALQEEYEREYRRRGMEQHLRRDDPPAWPPSYYPSAPTASQAFEESSFYSHNNNTGFFDEIEIGDESFVRPPPTTRGISVPTIIPTLRQQEPTQLISKPKKKKSREGATYESSYRETPPISELAIVRPKSKYTTATPNEQTNHHHRSHHHDMSEDEMLARRLEQELRDEEYAREVVAREQVRRNHVTPHSIPNNTMTTSRCFGCAFRKCVCFIVSMVLLAIAAVLILYLLGLTDGVADFIPSYDDFRNEDPFNNANPADANLWRTSRSGLRLTMINALDEKWHGNFYKAVDEWDNGTPDALSLTTEMSQPDSVCLAVNGRVKVCNGNYGATNWRGINKVLLENNRIYSSAARMNDFYVKDSDTAQKQYTMCHEIGHAFGLPHTDEDFYNKDLFNCMDYTSKPENNMQPSAANFEFLVTLYGSIDGTIPAGGNRTGITAESAQDVEPHETSNNNNDRLLKDLPSEIERAFHEIDAVVDSSMFDGSSRKGWRQLHFSEHGQAHEIDMGNGFVVQLHMLGV